MSNEDYYKRENDMIWRDETHIWQDDRPAVEPPPKSLVVGAAVVLLLVLIAVLAPFIITLWRWAL